MLSRKWKKNGERGCQWVMSCEENPFVQMTYFMRTSWMMSQGRWIEKATKDFQTINQHFWTFSLSLSWITKTLQRHLLLVIQYVFDAVKATKVRWWNFFFFLMKFWRSYPNESFIKPQKLSGISMKSLLTLSTKYSYTHFVPLFLRIFFFFFFCSS